MIGFFFVQSRNLKIPAMGFSDSFIKTVSTPNTLSTITATNHPTVTDGSNEKNCFEDLIEKEKNASLIPDEEILASTEAIYFEEGADTGVYVLNVSDSLIRMWWNYGMGGGR